MAKLTAFCKVELTVYHKAVQTVEEKDIAWSEMMNGWVVMIKVV
jgi:hypothetical protein